MPRRKPTPPAERNKLKNIALFTQEEEQPLNPNSIALNTIKLPPSQPRRYFDPDSMNNLRASIKKEGFCNR